MPVAFRISVSRLNMSVFVSAAFDMQTLYLTPISYRVILIFTPCVICQHGIASHPPRLRLSAAHPLAASNNNNEHTHTHTNSTTHACHRFASFDRHTAITINPERRVRAYEVCVRGFQRNSQMCFHTSMRHAVTPKGVCTRSCAYKSFPSAIRT